ncbi:unnamed protein product [Albugo candida]|uniref:Uncharacterized protein n=1 Tax=Albugo candida TaxID=65357 RepID=A0A024FUE0_9STRA|nr:unnamed protein product [Albugo candida]|eukprot:CCI10502.1 unnamed protein product [Albugo candida]
MELNFISQCDRKYLPNRSALTARIHEISRTHSLPSYQILISVISKRFSKLGYGKAPESRNTAFAFRRAWALLLALCTGRRNLSLIMLKNCSVTSREKSEGRAITCHRMKITFSIVSCFGATFFLYVMSAESRLFTESSGESILLLMVHLAFTSDSTPICLRNFNKVHESIYSSLSSSRPRNRNIFCRFSTFV